jgi:C_GCAxxG_C_C family probable redox protein
MNLSKLEAYPSKEALAEELRRLTIESEVKHHGCCQVIVQTFLDILGVQNEALSMAASPFVGGLALTGNNCGAVIGGLMVLGAVFGRKELQEGMPGLLKGIKPMRKLVKVFSDKHGTVNCRDLTGVMLADSMQAQGYFAAGGLERCAGMMADVAAWVGEVLYEEQMLRKRAKD